MSARVAVLALAVALLVVPTAGAAAAMQLSAVDVSGQPTVRLSVVTPTPSTQAPALRENGQPVIGFTAENLGRAKSIALALDRSRSMAGGALADAAAAARAFVAAKPDDDRIGLVGFGRKASQLTTFSTSTIDADGALAAFAIDEQQGTALYDAVRLGARALAGEPLAARVLIVLTDGDDTTSRATLAEAARAARDADVAVYPIGIESKDFQREPLEELASKTGGRYFAAATTAALREIYSTIASELKRTWRVSYITGGLSGESVSLQARLPGYAPVTQRIRLPGASATVVAAEPSRLIPGFLYENNVGTMLVALFTGSAAILVVGLMVATPGSERLRRRIEPHAAIVKKHGKSAPKERFAAASGVMLATEKSFSKSRLWRRLHTMLERADVPLRTVEFFYICAGSGLLLGLVSAFAAAPTLVILLAMGLGTFAPVGFMSFKAKRRLTAIDEQLPDLLITIAASLKAGHSFRQGIQAVVDEGQPPAAAEFKRVLTETSLGRPMDDALDEMADRIGSKNLSFVITAVTIQRQVGGSLAGIFDMVADAVRQRQQFARKIRSLTAMGRMSAYTLIGLPFFIAAALTLMNRDYMGPLYHTPEGHMLMILGLVMMMVGSLILKKIVSMKG